MKSIPSGELVSFDKKSGGVAIDSITFNKDELVVSVLAALNSEETDSKVEYVFKSVRGFLLLDEGDLIALWETKQFWTGHILYQIKENSIFEGISKIPGILSVSLPMESLEHLKEWLVASADDCLLVLTNHEPEIKVNEIRL